MKIVAVLELGASAGGGFAQGINAIVQMQRICAGRFEFEVATSEAANRAVLEGLGVQASVFSFGLLDKLPLDALWHPLQRRMRLVGPLERNLIARGCDLVYFVSALGTLATLQRLNYIATVWDLCHRDMPEFPEVREFGESRARDRFYRAHLPAAAAVVADSDLSADAMVRRYGVDRERVLAMPFAPSTFLERSQALDTAQVLAQHDLSEGYFFYPAQFWAHKNHMRIVEALRILEDRGVQATVAFAGGDQGSRAHVERYVRQHGLGQRVRFLGFVPTQHLRGLYEACLAVVMPSYFGPTNLPPLEAWTMGKPLIYSARFAQQAGDAALLVDPDDAGELADAMQACLQAPVREGLVQRGARRLQEIEQQRTAAESDLLARLLQFEQRRRCWSGR